MKVSVTEIKDCYNPDEKLDDDSLWLVKFVVRPVSFYLSVLFIELSFSANGVTWLSMLLGVIGSLFLALGSGFELIGCLLLIIWLVLDHVDGNLARHYKTQSKYGDFLDTIACYLVLALFPLGLGVGAYFKEESFIIPFYVLLLGALSSLLSILPRLFYQKMKAYNFDEQGYQGTISINTGTSTVGRSIYALYRLVINAINPSGFLFIILFASILLDFSDLFLIVYTSILFIAFLFSFYKIIRQMENR